MRQTHAWFRRWPRGRAEPRRIGLLILIGGLGLLGIKLATTPGPGQLATPKADPEPAATSPAGIFAGLRPKAGDQMALPRIGLRWTFDLVRRDTVSNLARSAAEGVSGALGRAVTGGPGPATQASLVPSFLSDRDSTGGSGASGRIRFRVHLIAPQGGLEIIRETGRPELLLTLENDFPLGECEWWVEAFLPGRPAVLSSKERFTLQR